MSSYELAETNEKIKSLIKEIEEPNKTLSAEKYNTCNNSIDGLQSTMEKTGKIDPMNDGCENTLKL